MKKRHHNLHAGWGCRKGVRSKVFVVLACAAVIATAAVGGTMAWIHTAPQTVTNIFTESAVACEVREDFDGSVKSNVNVTNTGDTSAYIRVKLVSYRVNEENQKIGGSAEISVFTPGNGWVFKDGFYYYKFPVAPGNQPETPLIDADGIQLLKYTDMDGGKQVIEVVAEAIQAEGINGAGTKAVVAAWGVDPETLGSGGRR